MIQSISINSPNYITFKQNKNPYSDIEIFNKIKENSDNKNEIIKLLQQLEDFQSPVDKDGNHILHVLVKQGNLDAIEHMLINPLRTKEIINTPGQNGLVALQMTDSPDIIMFLLSKGANMDLIGKTKPKKVQASKTTIDNAQVHDVKDELAKLQATQNIRTNSVSSSVAINGYKSNIANEQKKEPLKKEIPETKVSKVETPKSGTEKVTNFFSTFTRKTSKKSVKDESKNSTEVSSNISNNQEEKLINSNTDNAIQVLQKDTFLGKPLEANSKLGIKIPETSEYIRIDSEYNVGLDDIVGLDYIKNSLKKVLLNQL